VTALAEAVAVPRPDDPADRGETLIHDRVVQRIVSASAAEVSGTGGAQRRVLGVAVSGADRPVAQADVNGNVVTARVSLSMSYPSPVREIAAQVRGRVSQRVEELTGLRVAEVDVVVDALVPDVEPRVR